MSGKRQMPRVRIFYYREKLAVDFSCFDKRNCYRRSVHSVFVISLKLIEPKLQTRRDN